MTSEVPQSEPWTSGQIQRVRRRQGIVAAAIAIGLLLAVLSVPVGCMLKVREYREACRPIESLGGFVRASGDGMGMMSGIRGVNGIYLNDTKTSDADLAGLRSYLERLPDVHYLRLDGTHITDKGLEVLGAVEIPELNVCRTHVTKRGVERYKAQHPTRQINSDFDVADVKVQGDAKSREQQD